MQFEETLEGFEGTVTGQSNNATLIQRVYARTANFISALKEIQQLPEAIGNSIDDAVCKYIDFAYVFDNKGKIIGGKNPLQIDLTNKSFEAINCQKFPDFQLESSRSLIIIEFFTHCCINCIHSIEDIRQVYEELQALLKSQQNETNSYFGLKIISIHSPKFTREKDSDSIKAFVNRMKMDHSDVINDPSCILWNDLGISCWPTVLIFGTNPIGSGMNLLFTLMGEGHKETLSLILKSSLKCFDRRVEFKNSTLVETVPKSHLIISDSEICSPASFLKYPGKITYFQKKLAIADSGNNRIVICSTDGNVKHIIGGVEKGNVDGDFETSRFYTPQGIAFQTDTVFYVADTGNHTIRKVDLNTGCVTTLISSNWSYTMGDETINLRSPWDLTFYSENILLVASAGNHRIFAYFFAKSKLFNSEYPENSFAIIAGSGKEENRNNSYILKASFAQPSGICVRRDLINNDNENTIIYIADSESSSIRSITSTGKVVGVVGGARDPTDLFAFGDTDGKGVSVRLQHPMGVCWNVLESKIFIADTYNNKIKSIDAITNECTTIIGDGIAGNQVGEFTANNEIGLARLNEPSGISYDNEHGVLYIADTNNHTIKIADMLQKTVYPVPLQITTSSRNLEFLKRDWNATFEVPINSLVKLVDLQVLITNIPNNFEGGQWNAVPLDSVGEKCSGEVKKSIDSDVGKLNVMCQCNKKQYSISVDIFLCGPSSCYKKSMKFLIKFSCLNDSNENIISDNNISACFKYEPDHSFFNPN